MKNIILLALLASAAIGSAQSLKVVSGPIIDKDNIKDNSFNFKDFIRAEAFGSIGSKFFLDKQNKVMYIGLAADKDRQYRFGILENYISLAGTKAMKLEDMGMVGERYMLINMEEIDGKRFIFYVSGEDEKSTLYVNQMDDNFVLLGAPIKLGTGKYYNESFSVRFSEDKKSMLILQRGNGPLEKKMSAAASFREPETVFCSMRDVQFNEVWQQEFNVPEGEKNSTLQSIAIDNARNMYMLVAWDKEKVRKVSLLQYYQATKERKVTPIGRAQGKTYNCLLRILNGTTPVVAGLYDQKEEGYFIATVDPMSQSAKEIHGKVFPKEFPLHDGFIQPEYFGVDDIAMTDNGNITITIEGGVQLSSNTSVAFNYSPVFVKQVDASGKDVWQRIVYKQQSMPYIPNGGSHGVLVKGNDIIILYSDHEDNAKLTADQKKVKFYRRWNGILVSQRIDPTGKVTKEVYPPAINSEYSLDPRYMMRISDNLYQTQFWRLQGAKFTFSYATVEVN